MHQNTSNHIEPKIGFDQLDPSSESDSDQFDLNDFQTVDQLSEKYDQFPKAQLKWWIRNRHNNGLAASVAKTHRGLLIFVPGFYEWLKQHCGK